MEISLWEKLLFNLGLPDKILPNKAINVLSTMVYLIAKDIKKESFRLFGKQ